MVLLAVSLLIARLNMFVCIMPYIHIHIIYYVMYIPPYMSIVRTKLAILPSAFIGKTVYHAEFGPC